MQEIVADDDSLEREMTGELRGDNFLLETHEAGLADDSRH